MPTLVVGYGRVNKKFREIRFGDQQLGTNFRCWFNCRSVMFVLVEVAVSTATGFSVDTGEKFPPARGDPGDDGVKLRDPGGAGRDRPVRLVQIQVPEWKNGAIVGARSRRSRYLGGGAGL